MKQISIPTVLSNTQITRIFLLATVFLISGFLYAQNKDLKLTFDPAVIKNGYFNNGIYTNLNQFLTNSPEAEFPIRLDYRNDFLVYIGAKENVLMYFDNETNEFKPYTKSNWGVCISNHVYIKHSGKYIMIQPIGRYSFFSKEHFILQQDFNNDVHIIPTPELYSADKEFIIDFKTDKRYKLNKFNVESILMTEDMSLYEEFVKSDHKKYLVKEFILKLNNKY
jgi:hypothetical protein